MWDMLCGTKSTLLSHSAYTHLLTRYSRLTSADVSVALPDTAALQQDQRRLGGADGNLNVLHDG